MSRLASYAAALVIGLVISACVDRPAEPISPHPARTAAHEAPRALCGDAVRPCELDAIVVSGGHDAEVGSAAAAR